MYEHYFINANQARKIALAIKQDISNYVNEHQEEYSVFLKNQDDYINKKGGVKGNEQT